MNKKQIIAACKRTTTAKINKLCKQIQDARAMEGLTSYPEAEGSSRAPFGATGNSKEEIKLAELIVNNPEIWQDITYEANAQFDSDYNNSNYIECIAKL